MTEKTLKFLDEFLNVSPKEDETICEAEWDGLSEFLWQIALHLLELKGKNEAEVFKEQFTQIEENSDRIKFIVDDQLTSKHINLIVDRLMSLVPTESLKNPKLAEELSKEGKQLKDAHHGYENAVLKYNQAIEISRIPSKETPSKLSNYLTERGECLYKLGHVREAFADFEEAILVCKSRSRIPWLTFMKSQCLKRLGRDEESLKVYEESRSQVSRFIAPAERETYFSRFASLREANSKKVNNKEVPTRPPKLRENAKLPGALNTLRLAFDNEKGRVVKATTDIKKGTVVMSEQALAQWLSPSFYNYFCNYCLTKLTARFIACRSCIVKYCSLACESKAWNEYHGIECNFIEIFKHFSFAHLAIRLIFTFGFDNILQVMNEKPVSITEFVNHGFPRDYRSWYSLFGNKDYLNVEQLFSFCIGSAILTKVAHEMGAITAADHYFDFAAILLKHIFQININCYSITDTDIHLVNDYNIYVEKGSGEKFGVGVYLSSSMPSHSCDCNCTKHSVGSQLVLVTDMEILAGEEVTVTYYPYFTKMSVKDRKTFLKEHYLFDCNCNACRNRLENVFYAFRCPDCSGALVYNEDHSNYCLNCGAEYESIAPLFDEIETITNDLEKGRQLMEQKQFKSAKERFLTALENIGNIFYSFTRQMDALEELCNLYETKKNYKEAFNCCLKMAFIEQKLNGNDTLEAVALLVKASNYLLLDAKSSFLPILPRGSKMKKTRDLFFTAIKMLDEIRKREFQVLRHAFIPQFQLIPQLTDNLNIANMV